MGTPSYMAPEQAQGEKLDGRADLFSLGVVLYRLCTGELPFKGDNPMSVLMALASREPPRVRDVNSAISPALSDLVMGLLVKNPAKRIGSAKEVVQKIVAIDRTLTTRGRQSSIDLTIAQQGDGGPRSPAVENPQKAQTEAMPPPVVPSVKQATGPRLSSRGAAGTSRKVLLIGLAAVLLAGLGVGGWVIIRNKDGPAVARIQVPEGGGVETPNASKQPATSTSRPIVPAPPASYALAFDGSSSYVTMPTFFYNGSHPLTVEAWAVLQREPGSKVEILLGNPQTGGGFNILMIGQKWGCEINLEEGNNPKPKKAPWYKAREARPLPRKRLIHLAGVYDGKEEIRFYVDGQLHSRVPAEGTHRPSKGLFALGADFDNGNSRRHFLGLINGVRISKSACYSNDFTPSKRFELDADTMALYHFDEGQGDELRDSSGNGHHGKIIGAKWVNVDGSPVTPPAVVYLDDLPETEWQGRGTLGKHGLAWTDKPFQWRNQRPAHALFTHPDLKLMASVAYALDGKYESLAAVVGLGHGRGSVSALTFRVFRDDRELWKSPPIQQPADEATLTVSVRGIRKLRLQVDCAGTSDSAHAVWIEPRLTLASALRAAKLSLADILTSPDYEWSTPENLGRAINAGTVMLRGLTDDERIILLSSGGKLMMSRRKTRDEPFPPAVPLPDAITRDVMHGASMTGDGLLLAFVSTREGSQGEDIWMSSRKSVDEPFGEPVRLPEPVNSKGSERHPVFSSDGLTLLITSTRPGSASGDIWMFRRESRDQPFGDPVQLPEPVNTPDWDIPVWVSNDGRVLCTRTQKGQVAMSKLFVRRSREAPFGPALSLPPWPNEAASELRISADGERLYFNARALPGGHGKSDIWMVRRVPKK
jgi:hypothetical protein